jgi:hypothetical protein
VNEIKPFRCKGCHLPLGDTDGLRLTIGRAIFTLPVTILCKDCGGVRVWRPVLATAPAPVFVEAETVIEEVQAQ